MLTEDELVRQAVSRLLPRDASRREGWLRRRGIRRGAEHTTRDFRSKRRPASKIINDSVAEMRRVLAHNDVAYLEDMYYQNRVEAPIDILVTIVRRQVDAYHAANNLLPEPPKLRRTCTGLFGPVATREEVAFGEWEE